MTRIAFNMDCATETLAQINLPDLTLAELKAAKATQINAQRDQCFQAGFTVSGTGTALDGKTLQTRDTEDKTNWLTSQASYSAAVGAGQGATSGATFRTATNETVVLTYAQGLNALLAMAAWGKDVMGNSWTLKDAVTAAANTAALDAIDVGAGWP